jgi:hypothetical protein
MTKHMIYIDFWKRITALACLLAMQEIPAAEKLHVKFAYVGDAQQSARLGASQGLSEANLQGQFLNQEYTLDTISAGAALTADYSGYIAIVAAVDQDTYRKLVEKLPDMPVFNATLEHDELRAACFANAMPCMLFPAHR